VTFLTELGAVPVLEEASPSAASVVLAIGHGRLTHTKATCLQASTTRPIPLQPAAEPGMERGVVQPIPRQKCPDQCRLR